MDADLDFFSPDFIAELNATQVLPDNAEEENQPHQEDNNQETNVESSPPEDQNVEENEILEEQGKRFFYETK